MPWPPLSKFKFASCFPPQHTTVPGGTPRTGVLRSGHAEGRRPQVGTPNHPSWSNMLFFFDMFFGETGDDDDDGDEEEQDEDEDEDDDDADDEEDETIEWWILGLCPGTQNAHPIDTFTVNIY